MIGRKIRVPLPPQKINFKYMKNNKQDSTFAVSRFGRDKRQRISSAEQVERRPRPQRDADNEGQRPAGHRSEFGAKRASYNPNFSADNRLRGSESRGTRKPYERSERGFAARKNYNSEERSFSGEEPRSEQRFSPRSEYGHQDRRQGGYKPAFKSQKGDSARGGYKSGNGGAKRAFRPKDDAQRSYPKYAAKQTGEIRLNKFLAQSGLC